MREQRTDDRGIKNEMRLNERVTLSIILMSYLHPALMMYLALDVADEHAGKGRGAGEQAEMIEQRERERETGEQRGRKRGARSVKSLGC